MADRIQVGFSVEDLHANEVNDRGGEERGLVLSKQITTTIIQAMVDLLTAKNIDITGCIHSSVIDANSTNGIFLNARRSAFHYGKELFV